MDGKQILRYEKLLGRDLTNKEIERIQRIKNTIKIADNDALWDILIAIEFQRSFYENIPHEIEKKTQSIFEKLSLATEKEIHLVQDKLAEKVIARADTLALQTHGMTLLTWGTMALSALLAYSGILLFAGYNIAQNGISSWQFLRMPMGVILGALGLICGCICGVLSAKKYAQDDKLWRKYSAIACGTLSIGAVLFALTFSLK